MTASSTLAPETVRSIVEAWLEDATVDEAVSWWTGGRELVCADGTTIRRRNPDDCGVLVVDGEAMFSASWRGL